MNLVYCLQETSIISEENARILLFFFCLQRYFVCGKETMKFFPRETEGLFIWI